MLHSRLGTITKSEITIPDSLGETVGGGAIARAEKLIGVLEETSLLALLDYLAENTGSDPALLTAKFCDRFNIASIAALPTTQFDTAVEYLVDQLPDSSIMDEALIGRSR